MKIERRNKKNKMTFFSIHLGEVFECSGCLYLKGDKGNSLELESGRCISFRDNTEVTRINGKFVETEDYESPF